MTLGETMFFAYCVLAVTAFTCQGLYFAAKGIQKHLADHKHVREIRQMDEALRKIER